MYAVGVAQDPGSVLVQMKSEDNHLGVASHFVVLAN